MFQSFRDAVRRCHSAHLRPNRNFWYDVAQKLCAPKKGGKQRNTTEKFCKSLQTMYSRFEQFRAEIHDIVTEQTSDGRQMWDDGHFTDTGQLNGDRQFNDGGQMRCEGQVSDGGQMRCEGQVSDGGQMRDDEQLSDGGQMRDDEQLSDGGQMRDDEQLSNGGQMRGDEQFSDGGQMGDDEQFSDGGQMRDDEQFSDGGQMRDGEQFSDGGQMSADGEASDDGQLNDGGQDNDGGQMSHDGQVSDRQMSGDEQHSAGTSRDNLINIAIPAESWKEMLNPYGDKLQKEWTKLMTDHIREHITPSCVLSFTSSSLRPKRQKKGTLYAGIRKV